MPNFNVIKKESGDSEQITRFIEEHWGAAFVVAHGMIFYPNDLPGFVTFNQSGSITGLITYSINGRQCEIITINSVHENQGIGTALLNKVFYLAGKKGYVRVWLITTNDNINALGFFQRRGFRIVAIHKNAVERSRKLKSSIPLTAPNGIPIMDEIELEYFPLNGV